MIEDSDSIEVPHWDATPKQRKSRHSFSKRPSDFSSSSRTSNSRRSGTSSSPRTPHSRRSSKHQHGTSPFQLGNENETGTPRSVNQSKRSTNKSPKRSPHWPNHSSRSSRRSGSSTGNLLPQGLPLGEDGSTRSHRRSSKSSNRSSRSPPRLSPHSSRRSGSSTRDLLPQGLQLEEGDSSPSYRRSSKSPKRSSHSSPRPSTQSSRRSGNDFKEEKKLQQKSPSTAVGAHAASASTRKSRKSLSKEKSSRRSSKLRTAEASSPYSPNSKEKHHLLPDTLALDVSKTVSDTNCESAGAYVSAKSPRKSLSKEKSSRRSSKLRTAEASSPYSPSSQRKQVSLDVAKEVLEIMDDGSEGQTDIEANPESDEAHEQPGKKRKKIVVCLCLFFLLAIVGSVVAFLTLRSKDDSPATVPDTVVDLNVTASPTVSTVPPSSMDVPSTLIPTPVMYRPSKEDCEAVANRLPVAGQDDVLTRSFGVVLDVTLDDPQSDQQATMDYLEAEIQRFLMPLLIGCPEDTLQRALQEDEGKVIPDDERYIVANGFVSWAPSTLEELDICESEMCIGGTFNLDLFLRDPNAKYLAIVKLMSAVFGSDLADLLQLQAPFVSVVLRAVINKEPTPSPSIAPSTSPSFVPSEGPSVMPVTSSPTKKPSPRPTIAPAVGVTQEPTQEPTTAPSPRPTPGPTPPPTPGPTPGPTPPPTPGPTAPPTPGPTTSPPTVAPVESPTSPSPTISSNPTTAPVAGPTLTPTFGPTFTPTFDPTFAPTSEPTFVPTNEPTVEPTFEPTFQPTFGPTLEPTSGPTPDPTSQPTFEPTLEPTLSPTSGPTPTPPPMTPVPTACPRYPSTANLETSTTRTTCSSHLQAGFSSNGYYSIDPSGSGSPFVVYCSQDTGGYALFVSHENLAAISEVSVVTPCDLGVLSFSNWSALYSSMTTGMWGEDEFGNRTFVSAFAIIIMSGGYLWDLPTLIATFYDPAQHGDEFKIFIK